MVREFLIMETLSDILYICHFENELFDTQTQKNQKILYEEISKLINQTLQFVIKKNQFNVNHCA